MKTFLLLGLMTLQLFMGTTCTQINCRKDQMRDFLSKKAPEILKMAHPTASFKGSEMKEDTLVEIQYGGMFQAEAETLLVRLELSPDFTEINSLSTLDSGSVQAFAAADFLRSFLGNIPGMEDMDPEVSKQLSPRHWVAMYLDGQWQNHQGVFPCD